MKGIYLECIKKSEKKNCIQILDSNLFSKLYEKCNPSQRCDVSSFYFPLLSKVTKEFSETYATKALKMLGMF